MMNLFVAIKRILQYTLSCVFVLFLGTPVLLTLTGCGGGQPPQTGLPTPSPAARVNSYVGSQGNSPSEVSPWTVTIDHTKNLYSYTNPNSVGSTVSGTFTPLTGGLMVLLNQNGYQNGLALEVPGEAIILRPGDNTNAPVFAVHQSSCFAISGNPVKFLFANSPGLTGNTTINNYNVYEAFYGQIYVSTNSDGSSWQFNNQTEYFNPDGKNVPLYASFPGYPSGFPATCSVASNGSAKVTPNPAPLAYFYDVTPSESISIPTEYVISPAGFFFENQNYTNVLSSPGIGGNWTIPNISAWGVSEPSESIATSSLATLNYVGFLFEAAHNGNPPRTRLVGFGNGQKSGVMSGGTFPNENPTQTPIENMSITFGKQDPLNNGVYYLAKLSTPDDDPGGITSGCLSYGLSPSGTPTCINNAIATVGYPVTEGYFNGQYVIILSAVSTITDNLGNTDNGTGNLEMLVLFQQ